MLPLDRPLPPRGPARHTAADALLAEVLQGLKELRWARELVVEDDLWGDLPSLIAAAEAWGAEEARRERARAQASG